jgi:uncharacterized Ntn-hydrolase superfamily protein
MKLKFSIFLLALVDTFSFQTAKAQDTFSIVALDSTTRQVGSAGASCVDLFQFGIGDYGFLGDLLPDTGAINTQAAYLAQNQMNATGRMRLGETPAQIVLWLNNNDFNNTSNTRQYGVVAFNGNSPSAAGFTGVGCIDYKNHVTGNINGFYYSIQGNILSGQAILDSMEAKFRRDPGGLACKLMAALQGANVVGADTRCASNGTSSLFAFLKVAEPNDTYGNPSLMVGVATPSNAQIEPIDSLQILFNAQQNCGTQGLSGKQSLAGIKVFPNPGKENIQFVELSGSNDNRMLSLEIFDLQGNLVCLDLNVENNMRVNLENYPDGMYFYHIRTTDGIVHKGKLIIQ